MFIRFGFFRFFLNLHGFFRYFLWILPLLSKIIIYPVLGFMTFSASSSYFSASFILDALLFLPYHTFISRILPLLPNKFLLLHLNLAFSYRFTLNTRNCHILIHAGLLLVLSKTQPKRLLLFTSHSHFQIWENITI